MITKIPSEKRDLVVSGTLFLFGVICLMYIAYTLGTLFRGATPVLNPESSYSMNKEEIECTEGNIISCAKQFFGIGK